MILRVNGTSTSKRASVPYRHPSDRPQLAPTRLSFPSFMYRPITPLVPPTTPTITCLALDVPMAKGSRGLMRRRDQCAPARGKWALAIATMPWMHTGFFGIGRRLWAWVSILSTLPHCPLADLCFTGNLLFSRLDIALEQAHETAAEYSRFSEDREAYIPSWEAMIFAWQVDHTQPNPYVIPKSGKTSSFHFVHELPLTDLVIYRCYRGRREAPTCAARG